MENKLVNFSLVMMFLFSLAAVAGGDSLSDKCSKDFQKVTMCMNFATAKSSTPTKDCCASVEQIKGSEPECLCYFIVQTHNGSEQIKSLGIQESRLLQLPSACKLANASLADCPKLLNISPTSPDYAIFANTSSASSPSTTPGSSSSTSTNDTSVAFKPKPHLGGLVAIAVAIFLFFSAAPVEIMTVNYT